MAKRTKNDPKRSKNTIVLQFDQSCSKASLPSGNGLTWDEIDAHHWACVTQDIAELLMVRSQGLVAPGKRLNENSGEDYETAGLRRVRSAMPYLQDVRTYQRDMPFQNHPDMSRFFEAANQASFAIMQSQVDQLISGLKLQKIDEDNTDFFRKSCLGVVTDTSHTLDQIVTLFWENITQAFDPDFTASPDDAYALAENIVEELKPLMPYTKEFYARIIADTTGFDEQQLTLRLGSQKASVVKFSAAKRAVFSPVS